MSRIEKSLKRLCEKMTGKTASGNCVCSIIDDMANKCEGMGNGGGGNEPIILYDNNDKVSMGATEIYDLICSGQDVYYCPQSSTEWGGTLLRFTHYDVGYPGESNSAVFSECGPYVRVYRINDNGEVTSQVYNIEK